MERTEHRDRSAPRLIGVVVAVTVATYAVLDLLLYRGRTVVLADLLVEAVVLGVCSAAVLWFVVLQPLRADAARERLATRGRERELQAEADRQEFDSRLHRALDMAETETQAYQVVQRGLVHSAGRLAGELLLADSSEAHLQQAVVSTGEGGAPGCRVGSPRSCPAIRRSQTLRFSSALDIDACPYLADRSEVDRSALCVPVSVAGRSIGVLHTTSEPAQPATDTEQARLEVIATQAGARIGLLRVMAATNLQAATDPLTGLLNRRSFENEVQQLLGSGRPFALAMADLDHFKQLNDTHGHGAGDQALRLFSRILRTALRSQDLVARYGGEEFILVFPELTVTEAARALQRVQEELLVALAAGTVPPFTASFGVTSSDRAGAFDELCKAADAALFRAKRAGRNRVVVDGQPPDPAQLPVADR